MSGPIVRTGTTPEFWKGWDRVFGNTEESESAKKPKKKAAAKAAKKSAKSKTAKKK